MQKGLFLRIGEGPYRFLLATDDVRKLVTRDGLQRQTDRASHTVVASWAMGDRRWPVLRLAGVLGFEAGEWEEAILLDGEEGAVGLAVESTQLLEESYAFDVRPFFPIGCCFGPQPLYKGVCKDGDALTLVFDAAGVKQMLRTALSA